MPRARLFWPGLTTAHPRPRHLLFRLLQLLLMLLLLPLFLLLLLLLPQSLQLQLQLLLLLLLLAAPKLPLLLSLPPVYCCTPQQLLDMFYGCCGGCWGGSC